MRRQSRGCPSGPNNRIHRMKWRGTWQRACDRRVGSLTSFPARSDSFRRDSPPDNPFIFFRREPPRQRVRIYRKHLGYKYHFLKHTCVKGIIILKYKCGIVVTRSSIMDSKGASAIMCSSRMCSDPNHRNPSESRLPVVPQVESLNGTTTRLPDLPYSSRPT